MPRQPALFISHGSPMMLITPSPARDFLSTLAPHLKPPRAILSVSAHWTTAMPTVSVDAEPETRHDFGGFPAELYTLKYPAPGAPDVGIKAAQLLRDQGIDATTAPQRAFDHGTWSVLKLAYPNANIPIAEMSVQPRQSAAWHYRLGQTLAPLRDDNVLIMGTGTMTHNLDAYMNGSFTSPPTWVTEFVDWMNDAIVSNQIDSLLDFASTAPHAHDNHPSFEHIMPLFVALGAASPNVAGLRLHASIEAGVLAMDAYQFD